MELPKAFIERVSATLGAEATAFLDALASSAPVSVRHHPIKGLHLNKTQPVPWCSSGFYLNERPIFTADPLFHAGAYYVQEASSMLIGSLAAELLKNIAEPIVMDACAAPGGKASHLAEVLSGRGVLIANEVIRTRVPALAHNLAKAGYGNVIITSSEAEQIATAGVAFDLIVCDAPCSGEGLLRKTAEAADEWSEKNLELCSLRQQRIVAGLTACLKQGGYLLYSTCTLNPEENEGNVSRFIREYGLEEVNIDITLIPGSMQAQHGYYMLPHRVQGEPFYFCVLQKTGPNHHPKGYRKGFDRVKARPQYLKADTPYVCWQKHEVTTLLPENIDPNAYGKLSIVKAGVPAGHTVSDKTQPAYETAWMNDLDVATLPQWEMNRSEALDYLKKNTQAPPDHISQGSIALATHGGLPLGWMKILQGRVNNYFPPHLRILKDFS